jgi:NitT/TauT family transport system substrate-binding protein
VALPDKVCVGALALALALALAACDPRAERNVDGAPLALTVATQDTPYSGLVAVADALGYFEDAGLTVTVDLYSSGFEALRGVMRGDADIATATDIAFASAMRDEPELRVIAAIGASAGSEVVARKDANVLEPADLRGKRVGYSPGTSSPYFLHSFLLAHGLSLEDVVLVAVPPARQVEAIVAGEVDAISAFDVNVYFVRQRLGDNALTWDTQDTLYFQWLLVTRQSSAASLEACTRLLRALIRAEDFATSHTQETMAIIAREWNIDPESLAYAASQARLFVSLNQSVVTALRTYVRWYAESEELTGDAPVVLSYLDSRPLDMLDPRLVTIFR